MLVYNIHPDTHALLGAAEADPDPENPGQFLIPAHATTDTPPAAVPNFVRVYVNGIWQYAPFEDVTATPTPTPTVTDAMVRFEAARRMEAAMGTEYLRGEVMTWTVQMMEAQALISNPVAPAPLLTALAAADGVTPIEYAQTVAAKVAQFTTAAATILAAQRRLLAIAPIDRPINFAVDETVWQAQA